MFIYNSLIEIDSKFVSSFHVLPIQNINAIRNDIYLDKYKNFLNNFLCFEKTVTQPFFDSLVYPSNQINDAMDMAREIFKSDLTLFTTSGSTISNQIAISSLPIKSEILVQKSVHQSIHFFLNMLGKKFTYIDEIELCQDRAMTIININKLNSLINENIDTLILNSQSYEGIMLDLEPLLTKFLSKNSNIKNIIIDEAWGGWTYFSQDMHDKSALVVAKKLNHKYGVNFIIIQSAHKSFFSLRQSGLIHVFGNSEIINSIKTSHFKLHTTSPSYPILASIELGINHARDEGRWHSKNAIELVRDFRIFISEKLSLFEVNDIPSNNGYYIFDPNKIWLKCNGISGKELRDILFNKYGIYTSRYSRNHILINFHYGVTNVCLNSLMEALVNIEVNINESNSNLKENSVSDCYVIPYPPGVPIVFPGQNISSLDLDKINKHKNDNTSMIYVKEAI